MNSSVSRRGVVAGVCATIAAITCLLVLSVGASEARGAGMLNVGMSTSATAANQHSTLSVTAEAANGTRSMEYFGFNLPESLRRNSAILPVCDDVVAWEGSPLADCPANTVVGSAQFKSPDFVDPISAVVYLVDGGTWSDLMIVAVDPSRGLNFRIALDGNFVDIGSGPQPLRFETLGMISPGQVGDLTHPTVPPISRIALSITGNSTDRLFMVKDSRLCSSSDAGEVAATILNGPRIDVTTSELRYSDCAPNLSISGPKSGDTVTSDSVTFGFSATGTRSLACKLVAMNSFGNSGISGWAYSSCGTAGTPGTRVYSGLQSGVYRFTVSMGGPEFETRVFQVD